MNTNVPNPTTTPPAPLATGAVARMLARELDRRVTERTISVELRRWTEAELPPIRRGRRQWSPAHVEMLRQRLAE